MIAAQLKELLDFAKQAEKDYLASSKSRELYRIKNMAWNTLHSAINSSVPLIMINDLGDRLIINAVGLLCSDTMMHYSTHTSPKFYESGHTLRAIVDFETDPASVR